MIYTVSITSQGQISIPAKIRRELGFTKNNKAIVSVKKGKVTIEPAKDILELGGSLKTNKKPLSNQQLHDLFATYMAGEYSKGIRKK